MNPWNVAWRGLIYHRAPHLAFAACVALCAALITGTLLVGDSVRGSLRERVEARLGGIAAVLMTEQSTFRDQLPAAMKAEGLPGIASAVLAVRGSATDPSTRATVPGLLVLGVDDAFWDLSPGRRPPAGWDAATGFVNPAARGLFAGGVLPKELVLRTERPGDISRDMAAAQRAGFQASGRVSLGGVLDIATFAHFGLHTDPLTQPLLIVPRALLQTLAELEGRANMLLCDATAAGNAAEVLQRAWSIEDAGLYWQGDEVRSRAVFLPEPVTERIAALPDSRKVFGYFVNAITGPADTAPYCVVAGIDGEEEIPLPAEITPGTVWINTWLAERIGASPGDKITMRYFVIGERRQLEERESALKVAGVLPMLGGTADRTFMPDFPGLAETESCYDWDPGLPVNLDAITPADEAYWKEWQGTPKAFLAFSDAQRLFANPFGNSTAVRFPTDMMNALKIRATMNPELAGLRVLNVRDRAGKAAGEGLDFGSLFASMAMFLIVSALCLAGLVVSLALESRVKEFGMLRAMGFTPGQSKAWWWREQMPAIMGGALLGGPLGYLVQTALLFGLNRVWLGATGGIAIAAGWSWTSLLAGPIAAMFIACLVIFLRLRGFMNRPVLGMLGGETEEPAIPAKRMRQFRWYWLPMLGGIVLLAIGRSLPPSSQAVGFFMAGALFLTSWLLWVRTLKIKSQRKTATALGLWDIAMRNAIRSRGRSLVTITLLALATFLVVSVGVNRKAPPGDWRERASGTGGFAWMTTLSQPLAPVKDWTELGFTGEEAVAMAPVGIRMRAGDDASCLNLARAQEPRVLGVPSNAMKGRFSVESAAGWDVLITADPDGTIPCVVDASTLQWGLALKVGDIITIQDPKTGRVRLRIAAVLEDSIFQGALIMDETHFARVFPESAGWVVVLGSEMKEGQEATEGAVFQVLRDYGPRYESTRARLAAFLEVQNTYLAIFEALGGLGLLLGTAGVGLIAARNTLERRGELAATAAIGFSERRIRRLMILEHGVLVLFGIGGGTLAGMIPLIASQLSALPTGAPALLVGAICLVAATSLITIVIAVHAAMRNLLPSALREG